MRIYKEQETYDYEKFPHTSKRKHPFVVSEGGKKEMCEIVENYAKEVAKENEKLIAKKLFEKNVNFDTVLHSMEHMTAEELKKIHEEIKEVPA